MTRTRKTIGGLVGLALAVGVPGALVLGTSAPAQACFDGCDGGDPPVFTLTATPTTVVAGSPVTATLWIQSGAQAPSDVSASSTFTISSGTCTGNVCTPAAHGTVTITGSDPVFPNSTTSTNITVLPVPDHLTIYPISAAATAGQPVTFTVWTAAADGAAIADITSSATATLDGVACSPGTCTAPTTPGTYTLTATDGSLSGTTDMLVQAEQPARLVVTPVAHGVWNDDYPVAFLTEAYGAAGDDLGNVTGAATLTVSPDGSCDSSYCTPDTAGPHTVTAAYLGATGSVTLDATAPAPTVVPLLLDARVGVPYTGTVLSFQDDTSFARLASGSAPVPPGLRLAAPGVLTGTPTAAGTFTFDVVGGDENGRQQKQVTITIEPGTLPKPTVSISGTSVSEGSSGRTPATLTVRLSHAGGTPVTVSWHTANGTAVAGRDYVAAHGTVTIPAGQLTATVQVSVIGDKIKEGNEKFTVVLTSPRNATLGTARGVVTITNDD